VKVLPELFRDDPERRRRFEREARAISHVTHPHICTLYDVGEHDGLTFLVMELVEGETLAARLGSGPLPVDLALRYGIEIAGALDRAHHHGIVHRDLKPANVMLTTDGAKLLDFGLARLRAEPAGVGPGPPTRGAPSTADGAILGTLPYLAPEQLEGKEADARSDIFAFGAVLYEVLCGRRAFDADSRARVISAILRDEPPPISAHQPLVPASLDRVVRTCLAKQPDQRWQSAADLTRELQSILDERRALADAGPSVHARGALEAAQDSSAAQRPSVPKTRAVGRTTWIAASLLLVLASAWLIFGRISNRGGAPADAGPPVGPNQRVAVLPFSYKGADTHAYFGESMVDLLSKTLDGAGPLQTVDPRAVLGLLRQQRGGRPDAGSSPEVQGATLDLARGVANALDVRRFVLGDIVEAGGRLRIAARLYRTDGVDDSVVGDVEGVPDELFRLVDDLTAQLATSVGAAPGAQLRKSAARTTTSLKALKAFLRGEQLFRGGRMQGDAALAAYQQAVDLDSSFAIAWYRLSQLAYFSGTALGRVTEYAEIAARHSHDLPWRERRLLEAYWAWTRGAVLESEHAYQEILQKYPDDVESLFGAGLVLGGDSGWLQARPRNSARQMLQAFLRYEPENTMGLWYLGHSEAGDGNCEAAHSAYRRAFPGHEIGPAFHAVVAFCGPPSKEQEALIQAARGKPLRLFNAQWVSSVSRNPRAAAALVRVAEPNEDAPSRAVKDLFLAETELALGHAEAARERFAQLATVNPDWAVADSAYRRLASHHRIETDELRRLLASVQRWDAGAIPLAVTAPRGTAIELRQLRHDGVHQHLRTYLLGRIYAQLHDFQSALRYAGELDRMGSPKDAGSLNQDLAHSVRAHVLTQQGKLEDALHALEAAPREMPFSRRPHSWAFGQPQERFLRADLLSRLGRHEEALVWYQSIHYWPEAVLAGPSHLRQGEIFERLGRREQAIEQYRRFVDLWRDCDPEFRPMVKSAEFALQRLGSS
jgi:tetratricopeptide (TPR) repeat protein